MKEGTKKEEKKESPKKEMRELKTGKDKEINPKAELKSRKKKYFPSSDGSVLI